MMTDPKAHESRAFQGWVAANWLTPPPPGGRGVTARVKIVSWSWSLVANASLMGMIDKTVGLIKTNKKYRTVVGLQ